jgi:dihydroorotase
MDIMHYHTLYKYQPPLRGTQHQKALWQGLQNGVIDYVSSNHTLADYVSKQEPFAIAQAGGPHAFILIPWLLTMATQLNIKVEQALSWVGSQIICPLNAFNSQIPMGQPLYCLQNIANVWQNHLNLQYPSAMHGTEFAYTLKCMPKNNQESLKTLQSSLG